jgi:hypothetical protein
MPRFHSSLTATKLDFEVPQATGLAPEIGSQHGCTCRMRFYEVKRDERLPMARVTDLETLPRINRPPTKGPFTWTDDLAGAR